MAGEFVDTVLDASHRRDTDYLVCKSSLIVHCKFIFEHSSGSRRKAVDKLPVLRITNLFTEISYLYNESIAIPVAT